MPPHVFALTAERLDYGRFDRSKEGYVLAEYRTVELPRATFTDGLLGGPLREPAVFERGIAELIGELAGPIRSGTLVLPDAWLRVAFTEGGDVPPGGNGRQEVLRWKLKRLVPFRVEELRVQGAEILSPVAGEPPRLLLGFALEILVDQLERAFAGAGVELGLITNASLAVLTALQPPLAEGVRGLDLDGLVVVADDGYSLVFARGPEPLLFRYKGALHEVEEGARKTLVLRDLRLTRNFLADQLGELPLGRLVLVADPAEEPRWVDWLAEGLGRPVEPLGTSHLPPISGLPAMSLAELAPLVGGAHGEVE